MRQKVMKNFLMMMRYCCLKLQGYLVSKCRGGTSGSGVLTCSISLCCLLQVHTTFIATVAAQIGQDAGRGGGDRWGGGVWVGGKGREEGCQGSSAGQQASSQRVEMTVRPAVENTCCRCCK